MSEWRISKAWYQWQVSNGQRYFDVPHGEAAQWLADMLNAADRAKAQLEKLSLEEDHYGCGQDPCDQCRAEKAEAEVAALGKTLNDLNDGALELEAELAHVQAREAAIRDRNARLEEALEMVILYHRGSPWDADMAKRWERWTGRPEAHTRALCDQLRSLRSSALAPDAGSEDGWDLCWHDILRDRCEECRRPPQIYRSPEQARALVVCVIEGCAVRAEHYGDLRSPVEPRPPYTHRWEGEQAASSGIAHTLRALDPDSFLKETKS